MFCSKCGQQLPDDAKFCSSCGNQILRQETNSKPNDKVVLRKSQAESNVDNTKNEIGANQIENLSIVHKFMFYLFSGSLLRQLMLGTIIIIVLSIIVWIYSSIFGHDNIYILVIIGGIVLFAYSSSFMSKNLISLNWKHLVFFVYIFAIGHICDSLFSEKYSINGDPKHDAKILYELSLNPRKYTEDGTYERVMKEVSDEYEYDKSNKGMQNCRERLNQLIDYQSQYERGELK